MNTFTIPVLETKRFILKGPQQEDFEESAAMWADPLVARYTTGYSLTQEEAWAKLLRNIGHWAALHYGPWVIRDKVSGRFVGECGFSDNKRQAEPSWDGTPEISTALASWAHSKGYALEILNAVVNWADEHLPAKETVTLVYPENIPSVKLARRFGFVEHSSVLYKGELNLLFKRVQPMQTLEDMQLVDKTA